MWSAPFISGGLALAGGLLVVALKWIVIGRFKPGAYPLWSPFVWFNELITGAYESIAVPMIVNPLLGTPFLAFFMRLLGAKFGRAVCCDTPFFTEFDLVSVGNGSCLNANSTIQSHLFEDRVLKMSHLEIGSYCTVGNMSVVLYDTQMGDRSKLGALSLLMKGEVLPPSTGWFGIPSRAESSPQLAPVAEPSALAS
jgi:non-ribosomal peptide synthetase-like protein